MFVQIGKDIALNLKDISCIRTKEYEEGTPSQKFAIEFIGAARDCYLNYKTAKERDFAFDELLRLIGAIEWKND